jgi:3-phenylpropionate/cinnamic acid dioxygenase small subunit
MTLDAADRAALSDLVHRYAAHIDDRQFHSAAELFADDAELSLPDPPTTLAPIHQHRGRAAISDALATVATTIRTQHATVGEVFDDGPRIGTARGRIACVAHHWIARDEQMRDTVWYVRYDDEYLRNAADWRIARRVLTIDAIETRSARQVRRGS